MTIIKAEIIGMEALIKKIRKLKPGVITAFKSALYKEGTRIMKESKMRVPVNLGVLRSSGHVQKPVVSGTRITVDLGYGGPAEPYALYLHEGTGPAVGRPQFFPPPDEIEKWMATKREGRKSRGSKKASKQSSATKKISKKSGAKKASKRGIKGNAWLVARSIGSHGLTPLKYLEIPFMQAKNGMTARLAKDIKTRLKKR